MSATVLYITNLLEQGEHVSPAPAHIAQVRPVVVVDFGAPKHQGPIQTAGASEEFTPGHMNDAIVRMLIE